MRTQLACQGI